MPRKMKQSQSVTPPVVKPVHCTKDQRESPSHTHAFLHTHSYKTSVYRVQTLPYKEWTENISLKAKKT